MAGSKLTDERPPIDTEVKLAEYLSRMFRDAKISDDQSDQVQVYTAIPDKLSIGKLYYFSAAVPATSIIAEGLWVYKSTGWAQAA